MTASWLTVQRGDAPLVVSIPHAGFEIPPDLCDRFVSPWLARKDADWWIDRLYSFAADMGATIVRTSMSRSLIDVNRDPSGASLYPGQATTELCPTTTFDGEPIYKDAALPSKDEIELRRRAWFDPYHEAIAVELTRLRAAHRKVVLYDAHSIRSRVPRLFDGDLPQFNIGTNSGGSCHAALTNMIEAICGQTGRGWVTNGRFKGGWTVRHHGRPGAGIHALQMELACRGYLKEPVEPLTPDVWPPRFHPDLADKMRVHLTDILTACVAFARS
jgi:N-formylglutamate deformylase